MENPSLYERGGYHNIAAVTDDLLPRLIGDPVLGRFCGNRGEDGLRREKQLLIDFLCANSGGPLTYVGRNMLSTHKGMKIDQKDWGNFSGHLKATHDHFQLPEKEKNEVFGFIESLKMEITED